MSSRAAPGLFELQCERDGDEGDEGQDGERALGSVVVGDDAEDRLEEAAGADGEAESRRRDSSDSIKARADFERKVPWRFRRPDIIDSRTLDTPARSRGRPPSGVTLIHPYCSLNSGKTSPPNEFYLSRVQGRPRQGA